MVHSAVENIRGFIAPKIIEGVLVLPKSCHRVSLKVLTDYSQSVPSKIKSDISKGSKTVNSLAFLEELLNFMPPLRPSHETDAEEFLLCCQSRHLFGVLSAPHSGVTLDLHMFLARCRPSTYYLVVNKRAVSSRKKIQRSGEHRGLETEQTTDILSPRRHGTAFFAIMEVREMRNHVIIYEKYV